MKPALFTAILPVVALSSALAFAGDKPPANSKPVSAIASSLEQQGYAPISEISFDDGRWEVEAYKNDQKRELRVDPQTGKILSDRPDH
ncbi:MAG TPA: PepSY domain-containing protein [Burkholderiales bacterium]|nr:PepSY domain-containing protein [Burkholderiales bacterium]